MVEQRRVKNESEECKNLKTKEARPTRDWNCSLKLSPTMTKQLPPLPPSATALPFVPISWPFPSPKVPFHSSLCHGHSITQMVPFRSPLPLLSDLKHSHCHFHLSQLQSLPLSTLLSYIHHRD